LNKQDKYKNFDELRKSEREGRDYIRLAEKRASKVTIIAPHGGGIERGTSEIAKALAGSEFSLYCFEGLKATGNKSLHITSTNFDEPMCVQLVKDSCIVLAIHGCDNEDETVHVGGRNSSLKNRMIEVIDAAGFKAKEDVSNHSGRDPKNICNRGTLSGGVQLEISKGLRSIMFRGLKRDERQITMPQFDRFVATIRKALLTPEAV
jgi:phage replication-related protein YjqB (UPF0714/DUF867 family)